MSTIQEEIDTVVRARAKIFENTLLIHAQVVTY